MTTAVLLQKYVFQSSLKVTKYLGNFFMKNLSSRTFKNRPILHQCIVSMQKKTIINGFNGFTSLSPECQKLQFKVCVWKAWSRWSEFAKDKMRQQSWHTTTTTTTTTIMTKTIWLRSSLINFAFRKTRLGLQDLGHGSGGSMVSMLARLLLWRSKFKSRF